MRTQIKTKKLSGKALMLAVLFLLFASNLSFAQPGWNKIFADTNGYFLSVFFPNSQTGYAVGVRIIGGVVYPHVVKTTNAGSHWFTQITPFTNEPNMNFQDVSFTDANTGIISMNHATNFAQGGLVRTTNGGTNWDIVYFPEYFCEIHFINSLTGYVSGHHFMWKTTNAGENWTEQNPSFSLVLAGIKFTDVNTGYVVGNQGNIRKTTNGGDNWNTLISNTTIHLWGIDFVNANTGFAVGGYHNINQNIILKTTNAGDNWVSVPHVNTDTTAWLYSVRFISQTTGYIIGWKSQVLKTTNGGLNWYNQSFPTSNYCLRTCYFTNANTGYIVGHSNPWVPGDSIGYIYKTTTGGEPTGIKPVSNEIPANYKLEQNYPNPFNAVTSIKFQVASVGDRSQETEVRLIVFDLIGREVATLINEKLQPGTYEVTFDAGNLPSGVYFYKLTTDKFIDTKKLVLIK